MNKHCFVISSDSLEEVRSRMVGFMITDDGTFFLNELPSQSFGTGCFVLIEREGDSIRIHQDFCGSFGLYLYRNAKGFLISNSFQALAERLANRLTLNQSFLESLIYDAEGPLDITGTLANEITCLESGKWVEILIPKKNLILHDRKLDFFHKKPETVEFFDALDRWYLKWVRFYHHLAANHAPFYADMSGGLDTRIILSMLRNANIDLNSAVRMTSHSSVNIPKDAEDMRISAIVSESLGFRLNTDIVRQRTAGHLDPAESYILSRQFTMGRTQYCRVHSFMEHRPVFFAKGLGSTIKGSVSKRGNPWCNLEDAVKETEIVTRPLIDNRKDLTDEEKNRLVEEILEHARDQVKRIVANYRHDDEHMAAYLYQRTWIEERDAKKILDQFLRNRIIVSPFIDPEITAFDYNPWGGDPLFLATLILSRYDPALLSFEIENRGFSEVSLEKADRLNRQFPVHIPSFPCVHGIHQETEMDACPYEETTAFLRLKLESESLVKHLDDAIGSELRQLILSGTPVELHEKRPFPPYALLALDEFLTIADLEP